MANTWTSMVIGMNRYIAVCRPLHADRICTASHARKQIVCVIIFSMVYSLPRFLEYRWIGGDKTFGLKELDHGDTWYFYIYVVGCDITFRYVIPLSLLLYFCVRLVLTLRAVRRVPQINRHGGRNVNNRITMMLVVLLGVFLVCQTPNILTRIWDIFVLYEFSFLCEWSYMVINYISPLCIIFNSSVNCLIYIVYNGRFRRMLCKGCIHRSEISPGTNFS